MRECRYTSAQRGQRMAPLPPADLAALNARSVRSVLYSNPCGARRLKCTRSGNRYTTVYGQTGNWDSIALTLPSFL